MSQQTRTSTPLTRSRAAGFSVIEVLIAAALLLLVALGILPMFSNSITNNVQGNVSSQGANFAREEAERLFQLPFNSPQLDPPAGSNELTTTAFYDLKTEVWIAEADWNDSTNQKAYTRTTRIRQFPINAIEFEAGDYEFEDSEVVAGGSDPGQIQLKEIRVSIVPEIGISATKGAVVVMFKSI